MLHREVARVKVDENMRDVVIAEFFIAMLHSLEAILENVSDLIDEGYSVREAIRMGLRKNKLTLGGLLQNNSGDSEQDSERDNGNDDDVDNDYAGEKADDDRRKIE